MTLTIEGCWRERFTASCRCTDQTRRLDGRLTARWTDDHLRATGVVDFNQSDFGIEPYSRFLGTVRVQDRVSIEFAIDAEP